MNTKILEWPVTLTQTETTVTWKNKNARLPDVIIWTAALGLVLPGTIPSKSGHNKQNL